MRGTQAKRIRRAVKLTGVDPTQTLYDIVRQRISRMEGEPRMWASWFMRHRDTSLKKELHRWPLLPREITMANGQPVTGPVIPGPYHNIRAKLSARAGRRIYKEAKHTWALA